MLSNKVRMIHAEFAHEAKALTALGFPPQKRTTEDLNGFAILHAAFSRSFGACAVVEGWHLRTFAD